MLTDIFTIVRKELKEFFMQRGSIRSGLTNIAIILVITGVLFPMQSGRQWITSPAGLISAAWFPLLLSMGLVADTFAGERERHTLETLLASRLSDQAILFGKMLAAILYGFVLGLIGMLLGALTVNLSIPGAGFYPLTNFVGALLFSLLGVTSIVGVGTLVSLHASSVRQAYQRLSLGFLVVWLPLILAPQFLPASSMAAIQRWLQSVNGAQVLQSVLLALFVVDVLLIRTALARFQRARLILD